jgi:6-phosphogluconolactonase
MSRLNVKTVGHMIHIFSDYETLSQATSKMIVESAQNKVQSDGIFCFVLSGGETPKRTYELLVQSTEMPWANTHIFWGDERYVSATDPRSNFGTAYEILLKRVPIPRQNIHEIVCADGPAASSERYTKTLRNFFAERAVNFDLILLGLGADGHTASLFPGTNLTDTNSRWVTDTTSPKSNLPRITLTPRLINQSKKIIFLVSGVAKAQVIKDVLSGNNESSGLPAQSIIPKSGRILWMIDRDAATLLEPILKPS